jgi:holo-[acyl-carrier protein] synthase
MILGVGFDLVDLGEFARTLERGGEKYTNRVYTVDEIAYCRAQPHPIQHFAARWAAKEGAIKALGISGAEGLKWVDFEIVSESSGKPVMLLHGEAAVRSRALTVTHIHVSLSHSRSASGAVVVVESSRRPRNTRQMNGKAPVGKIVQKGGL